MKTERGRDGDPPLSRRAFVIGAGAAVATGATGAASAADAGLALSVEATRPYSAAIDGLADAFEREVGSAPVDVTTSDGSPRERVLDGPADLLVSGDPTPAVAGRDGESELTRGVTVDGWATLAAPDGDWRESLRPGELAARAADGRPIETWSESDWESIAALEDGTDASTDEECASVRSHESDRTALVRGTRAYQYARGHGGVGYYEVSSADLGAPSTVRTRDDDVVPVVRLGYVYATRDTLEARAPRAFLDFYHRRAPERDDVAFYVDPQFELLGEQRRV